MAASKGTTLVDNDCNNSHTAHSNFCLSVLIEQRSATGRCGRYCNIGNKALPGSPASDVLLVIETSGGIRTGAVDCSTNGSSPSNSARRTSISVVRFPAYSSRDSAPFGDDRTHMHISHAVVYSFRERCSTSLGLFWAISATPVGPCVRKYW